MKYIKNNEALKVANSYKCKTFEYSFGDKDILQASIQKNGYCVNLISKELIYVLEGTGKLCFSDKSITFNEGDAILIDKNEKYYWETEYCRVSMTCNPAWSREQHMLVK